LSVVRFAQPIEDGDIFWHMIYGSQMVEHGPLRVGHSLFLDAGFESYRKGGLFVGNCSVQLAPSQVQVSLAAM
jgi:hypothetical protein